MLKYIHSPPQVCEDSAGSTANDGLEVIVNPPPRAYYSASFSLTLARPLDSFSRPSAQRAFVERLAKLFGDKDAGYIVGIGFEEAPAETGGPLSSSTLVRWANATLANNVECPESRIGLLRQVREFFFQCILGNLTSMVICAKPQQAKNIKSRVCPRSNKHGKVVLIKLEFNKTGRTSSWTDLSGEGWYLVFCEDYGLSLR